jgi:hypothetical protein
VSQATVRQANDQLRTLAYDRNETVPDGSAVLIVGPRQLVDPTAAVVAEPFVHIAFPEAMLDLAKDAVRAWKVIPSLSGSSETPWCQRFTAEGVIGDLVFVSMEERRGGAAGGGGEPSSPSGPRSAEGPSPRPSRRSFSPEYKLAIVAEYENARVWSRSTPTPSTSSSTQRR